MQAKLLASDGSAADSFGTSVALAGDTALLGAPEDVHLGEKTGSAYVFVRVGTSWTEQAKLVGSEVLFEDRFGSAVALDGDTAVVASDFGESAYVFTRSGTSWTEQAKLDPTSAGALRFSSVSVSGDTILAGSWVDSVNGAFSGSAHVFVRSGTQWLFEAKIVPSDGAAFEEFGRRLALDGDTAVIAAPGDDDLGVDSGSAYVFERSGTVWTEQAKLLASDGDPADGFGGSVSIEGGRIAIGATGADVPVSNTGAVYVFERSGTVWSERARLAAPDGAPFDLLGLSNDLSGERLLAGAYSDEGGSNSGAAYLFELSGATWLPVTKLVPHDSAPSQLFGTSLALQGDVSLIGALWDDENGGNAGAAYVYTPSGARPASYCTAKNGLVCGVPALTSTGAPSASQPSGFVLTAAPARSHRSGLFLYTDQGRSAVPFQGGTLCLAPPLRRSVAVSSGGAAACDGEFVLDWNAFAHGQLGGNPQAFLLQFNQGVNLQVWGRDSIATGSFLSDAIQYCVAP